MITAAAISLAFPVSPSPSLTSYCVQEPDFEEILSVTIPGALDHQNAEIEVRQVFDGTLSPRQQINHRCGGGVAVAVTV